MKLWTFEYPKPVPEMKAEERLIPWDRILVRSGFLHRPANAGAFDLTDENPQNVRFLRSLLSRMGLGDSLVGSTFSPPGADFDENRWLHAFYDYKRAHTEGGPGGDARSVQVYYLDPFISGVVRRLNLMGYTTCGACDGHGLHRTYITFSGNCDTAGIAVFLSQISGVRWAAGSNTWTIFTFAYGARGRERRDRRYELLSLAESLIHLSSGHQMVGR
jgi:hypothetical protein